MALVVMEGSSKLADWESCCVPVDGAVEWRQIYGGDMNGGGTW